MGMSTHIVGFKPPDDKWVRMKAVYDACKTAGIDVPEEVEQFFEYGEPDNAGVETSLSDVVEEWRDRYRNGYQIEVSKIPKDVKIIRFYNSW